MGYRVVYESPGVEANKYKRHYLVDAETDLADLPSDTATSSKAHVCGYGLAWEKSNDGTWVPVSNIIRPLMIYGDNEGGLHELQNH